MHMSMKRKLILVSAAIAVVLLAGLVLLLTGQPTPREGTLPPDPTPSPTMGPMETSFMLEPTPSPVPYINFTTDDENPLPESGYRHTLGSSYTIGGTVESNYPLKSVSVTITCAYNNDNDTYPYEKTVALKKTGTTTYSLTDPHTDNGISLAELVDFSQLQVGVNTLKLYAGCPGIRKQELARVRFYVIGPEWISMKKNQLNGSYDELMEFFGSEKRFLYRFQQVNGRYTMADPDWEETYITYIPGYPTGSEWKVHTDVVPYLEKAFGYLENTYVRVQGTNGDSGILKLADLILEYNGCFVSRYTSSMQAVSAHSFGSAIDINASMSPNKNTRDNKSILYEDVKNHLKYNGIVTGVLPMDAESAQEPDEDASATPIGTAQPITTEPPSPSPDVIPATDDQSTTPQAGTDQASPSEGNGRTVSYYSFTYDGEYQNCSLSIPETCVNYLLYELAFYRAGFKWAHYYRNTSDAMHFCLGEQVSGATHEGKGGLQKVTKYID